MKNLYLTTAIALLASPALAEITPEELWDSWQSLSMGMSVSARQQARSGSILVLRDVKTSFDFGFLSYEQIIDEVRLEALENGSVSVTYNSAYSGSASFSILDSYSQIQTFTGRFENTSGLAVGDVDDFIFEYSIGSMRQTGDADMNMAAEISATIDTDLRISGMRGASHVVASPNGTEINYTFSIDELSSIQNAVTPLPKRQSEATQVVNIQSSGIEAGIQLFLPTVQDAPVLSDGLRVDASVTVQKSNLSQTIRAPHMQMEFGFTGGAVTTDLHLDSEQAQLVVQREDFKLTVASPQLGPRPYSLGYANLLSSIRLPLHSSNAPQDTSFELRLGGVTVNDAVWAIADPANTLSHAPADFTIDTSASATLLLDWTDVEAVKAWQGPIAVLHNIKLQDLFIAFENARLTGDGEVAFSNNGPAPAPNGGMLNFSFEGMTALLDKLGSLPWVDHSLTANANGILRAFTTAGDGPDNQTSQITFTEDGHVAINGQKVR